MKQPRKRKVATRTEPRKVVIPIQVILRVPWAMTNENRAERTEVWAPDDYPRYALHVDNSLHRAQAQLIDLLSDSVPGEVIDSVNTGQNVSGILLWATRALNRLGRLVKEEGA